MRHCGLSGVRTVAMCAVALVTVCTQSPPAGATNVAPGRIISLIPSDDEVSQYVGLPVTRDGPPAVRPRVQDRLDERDECRVLLYGNTFDVWHSDYAAFRSQVWTYQPDKDRMYVGEAVGTFTDSAAARDHFNAAFNRNLFDTCNHALMRGPLMAPGITVELYDSQLKDDVMMWTAASKYNGQYTGYNTVFVVWHLNNVMAIAAIGQQGNPAQAVSRLAGYILDRVG